MEDENKLEDLKVRYKEIQDKYDLPSFEELNENFHIERIADVETEILIREVRKFIADKFSNYMRFVEAIIHPVNSPMFVFSIIKLIGEEEKKRLTEAYKKMAKNEVELIDVDIDFSEEKEARFIKESYKTWNEIKKDILVFVEVIKKNWDNEFEVETKGYFG